MYHHAWLSVFSDEAGGGVGEVVSVGWPQIPELKGIFSAMASCIAHSVTHFLKHQ